MSALQQRATARAPKTLRDHELCRRFLPCKNPPWKTTPLGLATALALALPLTAAEKPNLLLIYADDLGWDWPIPKEKHPLMSGSTLKDIPATEEHMEFWNELFSQPIPGGPTARGFDIYFGTDVPNWPPFCFIENDRTVGIPTEFLPVRLFQNNQASRQGPALPDWKLEPILPAIGYRSVALITEATEKQEPFLLYFSLTSPHTPLSVNDEWLGKSGLGLYGDFVMETDAIVGHVLAALDESGVADNTLVIFTSDNGCAHYIGMDELEAADPVPE